MGTGTHTQKPMAVCVLRTPHSRDQRSDNGACLPFFTTWNCAYVVEKDSGQPQNARRRPPSNARTSAVTATATWSVSNILGVHAVGTVPISYSANDTERDPHPLFVPFCRALVRCSADMAAFRRRVAAGGMLLVIAVMIRGASAYRGPVWPTMTASATESASFTPTGTPTASPCPSCTPMLNVTIASDQCGALGVCGTKQCALEVDIEFAYLDHLKLPGGHVWGNILASQDCKTWWHTGSSRDLYLGTSGRVNVSDGCYGDGDSALVVVTCVSQYLVRAPLQCSLMLLCKRFVLVSMPCGCCSTPPKRQD